MLTFNTLRFKDIQLAKEMIYHSDISRNSFYSTSKKSITYFTIVKGSYIVKSGKETIGLLIIDSSQKQFCFYPLYPKAVDLSLTQLIDSLDERFELSEYTFSFNCTSLQYIDGVEESCDVLSNIKFMKCNLMEYTKSLRGFEIKHHNLRIRNFIKKQDESLRVKLQNEIFSNVNGRVALTLKDVIAEEYSPKFLEDMCFILECDNIPIGYGQIMKINEEYYIVNFGVVPKYRGKGYARHFLTYIMLKGYEKGIENMKLTVDNKNIPAVRLYETSGFEEEKNSIKIKL